MSGNNLEVFITLMKEIELTWSYKRKTNTP